MNYIREINAFYDWLETNKLSVSAISLWYALMHINNKTGWKNEFTVALSVLSIKSGLSPRAVTNARKELSKKGRIKWESRNGNQSAQYTVNSLVGELQEIYADKVADNTTDKQTCKPTDISSTLYKLNVNENINIYTIEFEQELFNYWNQKDTVVHKKITNNFHIAIKRALSLYPLEDIITAVDHYAIMYNDASYNYCEYRWTIEKFLDDPKGIAFFMDDGQKWLSYSNRKGGSKNETPEFDDSELVLS